MPADGPAPHGARQQRRHHRHAQPGRSGRAQPAPGARSTWSATRGRVAARLTRAGTVFVGDYSAQACGDYVTGSNHVLPTSGAAAARGGLCAADFVRVANRPADHAPPACARIAPAGIALARAEGLTAHAASMDDSAPPARAVHGHDLPIRARDRTGRRRSGCTSTRTPPAARPPSSRRSARSRGTMWRPIPTTTPPSRPRRRRLGVAPNGWC